jgi:hypothetical protein
MRPEDQPIGYWLRRLDRLIEDTFEAVMRDEGLSRRHWQLMNLLRAHPADIAEITESMPPFWTEWEISPDEVVGGLTRRGWAQCGHDGRFQLTWPGETARDDLSARVQMVCRALTDGITPEEYTAAIGTLRRMAENLAKLAPVRADTRTD